MKKNLLIIALLLFSNFNLFSQEFKKFVPEKEPFKTFTFPKFDNKKFFKKEDLKSKIEFSIVDNMPIMKPENNMAPMPIYKPSDKVKYSLLIENPIKPDVLIPEKE